MEGELHIWNIFKFQIYFEEGLHKWPCFETVINVLFQMFSHGRTSFDLPGVSMLYISGRILFAHQLSDIFNFLFL